LDNFNWFSNFRAKTEFAVILLFFGHYLCFTLAVSPRSKTMRTILVHMEAAKCTMEGRTYKIAGTSLRAVRKTPHMQ
jgi:hypothetical protein